MIVRPRLFVRPGAEPAAARRRRRASATSAPAPPAASTAAAPPIRPRLAARLRSFLRPPFPLRVLEVVDGRIEMSDGAGASVEATGIDLSVLVSSGSARAVLAVGSLAVGRAGRRVDLGRVDADVTIEEGRVTVRELVAAGGAVTGTLRGRSDVAGVLALKGELSARLENLAALAGPAGGRRRRRRDSRARSRGPGATRR